MKLPQIYSQFDRESMNYKIYGFQYEIVQKQHQSHISDFWYFTKNLILH